MSTALSRDLRLDGYYVIRKRGGGKGGGEGYGGNSITFHESFLQTKSKSE